MCSLLSVAMQLCAWLACGWDGKCRSIGNQLLTRREVLVDVQSALCRYAALRVARLWMGWEVPIDRKSALDEKGSPCSWRSGVMAMLLVGSLMGAANSLSIVLQPEHQRNLTLLGSSLRTPTTARIRRDFPGPRGVSMHQYSPSVCSPET